MNWSHLTHRELRKAHHFIQKHGQIFASKDLPTGRTHIVQHSINTTSSLPIRQPPRRLPLAKQQEASDLIYKMLQDGIIEESSSPWSSPVVLVTKKDGTTRFCVDYRRLNDITKKDSYPLPRIDDTLSTLSGSTWFSTLDLKNGYWQVDIHPEDKEKTAFSTGTGLYQFTVMPFGLCNAPATFERLMEMVLKGLTWKICLVYLDDILVMGKSFDDHLKNLEEVFARIGDANLKLNPKKCLLFQKQVEFLGYTVTEKGIGTSVGKINAIREWPRPRDKQEVRSFLGICTYYRRFVEHFSSISAPLIQLTEHKNSYKWTNECEIAFRKLKSALCSAPILTHPQEEGMFLLDTDASNNGVGAVLSQLQDGEEKVIEYFSKIHTRPERNYCATRKELLAIVKAVSHFHSYLFGREFLVRTDHAALSWLLQMKKPEGQMARWIEKLQQYDFKIKHRAGKLHNNADALSRRPCSDCKHCDRIDKNEIVLPLRRTVALEHSDWTVAEIRKDQERDLDIGPILLMKETGGPKPTWEDISAKSPNVKALWVQWDSLCVKSGILKRIWESPNGKSSVEQLVVPRSRVTAILEEIHNGSSGSHFGVNKTLSKIRQRFYWLHCREDVENWCRQCTLCAASKGPNVRTRGKMHLYIVGAPFERVGIDVAGPFPITVEGNRYILVVSDYFTKWPEAYPIPNMEATTVATVFLENWVCRFGVPQELQSDQGRNFESSIFHRVAELLGIRKTRTTPLHPQSNGMVERFNQTMEKHLSMVVNKNQKDWDKHLPLFLMAYRAATHDATGQTPAGIVFGRELRLPCDLLFGSPIPEPSAVGDYVHDLKERLLETHAFVRERLHRAGQRMKSRHDYKTNSKGFQEGELVWLYNPQRKRGRSPKLTPAWEGPYTIITRINDVVYRIQKTRKSKLKVVHFNRLKLFKSLRNGNELVSD